MHIAKMQNSKNANAKMQNALTRSINKSNSATLNTCAKCARTRTEGDDKVCPHRSWAGCLVGCNLPKAARAAEAPSLQLAEGESRR